MRKKKKTSGYLSSDEKVFLKFNYNIIKKTKKIYFSLAAIAILLIVACNNDVPGNENVETGTLTATISFAEKSSGDLKSTRAAQSTAIPTVDWSNVEQVQLFLYNATTSLVTYSKTIDPKVTGQAQNFIYSWSDVPAGTYRLALLANVKSTDQIDTWVGTEKTGFNDANVLGKKFHPNYIANNLLGNADLQIDLRQTTLPGEGTTPVIHDWKHTALSKTGYLPPSEIFSAYSESVTITAGAKTELINDKKLTLKHEVSLLRARINRKTIPAQSNESAAPTHNNTSDFIVVQTLPMGLGLKVGNFEGGIFDVASNEGRVLVGSTGDKTYETTQPTTGYKPGGTIIDEDENFELWRDILVLPNAAVSEGITNKSADAAVDRKYFIIISMAVQPGYIYATGEVATEVDQPVYWYGEIAGVFTRNVIREVNMTLKTAGYPEIPPQPIKYGGLEIELGVPMEWDTTIERTDIEA